MEKIKISSAILCEGKYDKIKLSSLIDGTIITADGFSIFNNSEKRELLRRICMTKGLIIMTDSDKAGFFIRSKLAGMLPPDKVKNVYIPEIAGKEKRKNKPSKDGLLGVEGIDAATLREILLRAGVCDDSRTQIAPPIKKSELFSLGLSGGKDSASLRKKLCEALSLPSGLTANALLSACEMLGISLEDVERELFEIRKEEQNA